MKLFGPVWIWRALSGVAVFSLGGCNIIPAPSADATRYYLLSAPSAGEINSLPTSGGLRVGLRTVELAPYLHRNTLVVRAGQNEVTFPGEARWAEPLEQEVGAVLRTTLGSSPRVARVFLQPFAFEGARDCEVTVRVLHCEGDVSSEGKPVARFAAFYEVTTGTPSSRLVSRKMFVAPDLPWDGKNFAQLSLLLSNDVAALGRELSEALPTSTN